MTNPFRLLGLYRRADRVVDVLDEGRRDWETTPDRARSLYRSASWWARVGAAVRELVLALPIPDEVRRVLQMRSWKTSLAGISAILAIAVKVLQTGHVDWSTDAPAVLAAIGLVAAKDANVSGSEP